MQIVDMRFDDDTMLEQAASLLVEGFREHWPEAWPDLPSAREELAAFNTDERICRAAVDEQGQLLGWIGGLPFYALVWELHPLVVAAAARLQGVGRALVQDLEARVAERGGLTLMLGSDDEDNQTSLSGVDLYPDVWGHIQRIRNLRGHPYEFYQKLGYTIVGVVPDANGYGKPDILMAKRLGGRVPSS